MTNFLKLSYRNLIIVLFAVFAFTACNNESKEYSSSLSGTNGGRVEVASSSISVIVPKNAEVGKKATFRGACANVHKYIASADGFILKEEVVAGKSSWTFEYTFNTAGNRNFHINAFDVNGKVVASDNEGFYVAPAGGGGSSASLQQMIMRRAAGIAPHNRPYDFNGIGDCWGYVRQVWNAVLFDGREHTEDYASGYNKSRWIRSGAPYLPVADAPSNNWAKVTNFDNLPLGVPLSSHKGHAWGDQWHGAIYAGKVNGKHMMWDCSGRSSRNGAYYRPISESPKISNGFYHIPSFNKLRQ